MYLVILYILLIIVGLNDHSSRQGNPLCIAHRGASVIAPENTIAAFDKALQLKADYIEMDIQMTKDQKLVVIHDTKVNRTTNSKGFVKNFTLEELQTLDAGSWFHPSYKYERIPTLREVFRRYNGKIKFLIELKDPQLYPGIEKKLKRELVEWNLHNRGDSSVIVQSFNPISLKKLHKLLPEIPKGFLASLPPYEEQLKSLTHCEFINIHYLGATPNMIELYKENNFKNFVWPVNERAIYEKLKKMPVDGIITDCPNRLQPELNSNLDYFFRKMGEIVQFLSHLNIQGN